MSIVTCLECGNEYIAPDTTDIDNAVCPACGSHSMSWNLLSTSGEWVLWTPPDIQRDNDFKQPEPPRDPCPRKPCKPCQSGIDLGTFLITFIWGVIIVGCCVWFGEILFGFITSIYPIHIPPFIGAIICAVLLWVCVIYPVLKRLP